MKSWRSRKICTCKPIQSVSQLIFSTDAKHAYSIHGKMPTWQPRVAWILLFCKACTETFMYFPFTPKVLAKRVSHRIAAKFNCDSHLIYKINPTSFTSLSFSYKPSRLFRRNHFQVTSNQTILATHARSSVTIFKHFENSNKQTCKRHHNCWTLWRSTFFPL